MRTGGYRGRGGYNGNAGGYAGGNYGNGGFPSQTDTLNIRVTEVQQAVTEDDMRKVFDRAGANPRTVQIFPTQSPSETMVVAQFPDMHMAERVMSTLNNRNIYTNSNKMNISYSQPASLPNNGNGNVNNNSILSGGAPPVLSAPAPMYGGAAPQQNFQQQQQMPPQQQGMMMQQQMPQQMPYMDPMGNPMMMMDPMGGMGGRGMMRGGRGMGRGGRGGRGMQGNMGFNPMMMPYGGMPYGAMGMPMGRGGRFNPMMADGNQQRNNNAPTIYLSVTVVPTTEPLQSVFLLLEAFGGVVSIRRNQNKKEIVTVKMASIDDAEAAVRHTRRVPFAGGTVSAIRFPNYVERNPCTDEGDPNDQETTQFDFTASRHRSPGQRSKANPSKNIKITGCTNYTETDIVSYLTEKNFVAESITKEEDGSFAVVMPDTETAVKVLLSCQGNVCGEERSNVIFLEGPKEGEGEEGKTQEEGTKNEE